MREAVFLDRDGTLTATRVTDGKPFAPSSIDELTLLPGVAEGCHRLKAAGFLLIVVTNQPDVGRGTLSRTSVEEMHARLQALLPIDRVEVCYDAGPGEESGFRKPAPGMLLHAARDLGLDIARSFMVGDRWRDVECGARAGCTTVFIDCGYREELRRKPDYTVRSFVESVDLILSLKDPSPTGDAGCR
jgi:D-glycero-D-manno-heptose 1,7-bisphosphate phosphatase